MPAPHLTIRLCGGPLSSIPPVRAPSSHCRSTGKKSAPKHQLSLTPAVISVPLTKFQLSSTDTARNSHFTRVALWRRSGMTKRHTSPVLALDSTYSDLHTRATGWSSEQCTKKNQQQCVVIPSHVYLILNPPIPQYVSTLSTYSTTALRASNSPFWWQ